MRRDYGPISLYLLVGEPRKSKDASEPDFSRFE